MQMLAYYITSESISANRSNFSHSIITIIVIILIISYMLPGWLWREKKKMESKIKKSKIKEKRRYYPTFHILISSFGGKKTKKLQCKKVPGGILASASSFISLGIIYPLDYRSLFVPLRMWHYIVYLCLPKLVTTISVYSRRYNLWASSFPLEKINTKTMENCLQFQIIG